MMVLQSYFYALVGVLATLVAVVSVVDFFLDVCVLSHLHSDIWYGLARHFHQEIPILHHALLSDIHEFTRRHSLLQNSTSYDVIAYLYHISSTSRQLYTNLCRAM